MAIALKTVLIKTVGVGGLGLGVYDAHCRGKRESIRQGKNHMADNTVDAWLNTSRLESESDVEAAMRKGARDWMLDSPLPKICGNIKGYVKGVFESVADNVVPITLATGTLISKGGSFMSKAFASGLGIYGIYKVVRSFTSSARSRQAPD